MITEQIDLIAELAVLNGYDLQDSVSVVYYCDNTVKRREMSLSDSLEKLRLKLSKDPKTLGIDFKITI